MMMTNTKGMEMMKMKLPTSLNKSTPPRSPNERASL